MELVVITAEHILSGEAEALNMLFGLGLGRLHLRKPCAAETELRGLLDSIEPAFRGLIVLHDHFALVHEFGLAGVHLNRRNPELPEFGVCHISRSCHSLAELEGVQEFGYVFLSPVFDSISKLGYGQAFTAAELLEARENGVINERVYALGGVDENNIRDVARMGFGGAAVLGALWQEFMINNNLEALVAKFMRLKEATR